MVAIKALGARRLRHRHMAGAAEGMLEATDLSAAVRKEAEAAGMEDTSVAPGWGRITLAARRTTHSAAT